MNGNRERGKAGMVDKVSLDDFFDMLGRYGSDLGNWPLSSVQLDSVVAFLARSSAARDAVEDMRALESAQRHALPRPAAGLADRMLAAAGVPPVPMPIFALPRRRRPILH